MPFLVKKENGQLVFNDVAGYESRNPSTMWCIERANEIYNWNDFEEIQIYTDDHDYLNIDEYLTYSKKNSHNNLVPDFNFHAWPQVGIEDYTQFTFEIDKAGQENYEINKVGWIGNGNTNYTRRIMLEIGNNYSQLFEFFDMYWMKTDNIQLQASHYISTPDLVKKYAVLIDIEGLGYSGRLKHLLWSHRPVLLVDRPHKEFFFKYLKEWEHYIPVQRDLTDLVEKTNWIFENYEKAKEIAENAYQFSKKYLTREACYERWNKIITNIKK